MPISDRALCEWIQASVHGEVELLPQSRHVDEFEGKEPDTWLALLELLEHVTVEVSRLRRDCVVALAIPLGFSEFLQSEVVVNADTPRVLDEPPSLYVFAEPPDFRAFENVRTLVDDPLAVGKGGVEYELISWRDEQSRVNEWEFIDTLWVRMAPSYNSTPSLGAG